MTRPVPLEKKKQTDITSPLDPYSRDAGLLKSVLSDPRQRLAKVMPSPSPKRPESPVVLDDDHVPFDYMSSIGDDRLVKKILSGPYEPTKRALWTR